MPLPTCQCGSCRKCKVRLYTLKYYQKLRGDRPRLTSGPKPICNCGKCRNCKQRKKYREKLDVGMTPEESLELDALMNKYFIQKGWDKEPKWLR